MAILTEMGGWSASTRHRALAHLPQLRTYFRTVDLLTAGDSVRRDPGRIGQVRHFAGHGGRYLRRTLQVRGAVDRYDALLIQRGLYVLGPGAIVAPVERFAGRVVFDLDDAVFEPRPGLEHRGAAARWLWGPQQTLRLIRRADAIVVSTQALGEMLPERNVEPIVLPTVPDPSRYAIVPHSDDQPVVIGWAGTIGGIEFLDPLGAVFERIAREHVARLEVVSSRPWRSTAGFHRWRAEEATSLFGRFTIGIMPLPDTPYARAKAGFKLLEYMAAGLPVVASPVGVNCELVAASGAGLLADTPQEWEAALRELAGSAELRRELGRRGRAFVESYVDLPGQARTLAGLLSPHPS